MLNHCKIGLDEAQSHQMYNSDVISWIACLWLYGI